MMPKSALMTSAAMPQYRNDAEVEEKKALEKEKSEEKKPEEKSDAAKADAEAGEKLDRMLSCLDSMSKRMDALEESEKRDDDEEEEEEDEKKDAKRKDEWPDKDENRDSKRRDSKKDAHDEKIAADDDAKKDDEDEDDDKAKRLAADKKRDSARKDSRRADSELIARLDRLERMRSVTDEDRAAMAQIQSRADSAYSMLGDAAPRFMDGEEKNDYRVRLLKKLQPKSPKWKDYDFAKADSSLLDIAEKDVYADAVASAMSPADLAEGHLRMIRKVDETGRPHILWAGQPRAWMQQFQPPTRRVTQFETRSRPN